MLKIIVPDRENVPLKMCESMLVKNAIMHNYPVLPDSS